MVCGIVGGGVLAITGVARTVSAVGDYHRVTVPGTQTVRFEETGKHTVYLEYPGAADSAPVPPVTVRVIGPDGKEIALQQFSADKNVSYSYDGREGRGQYDLRVAKTGNYQISTEGSSGVTVTLGRGGAFGWVTWLIGGLGTVFGGLLVGIAFCIVLAARRGRSKRTPPTTGSRNRQDNRNPRDRQGRPDHRAPRNHQDYPPRRSPQMY